MKDLRPLLAFAKQYRMCPPPRVLDDAVHAADLKRHFSICPYCTPDGVEKRRLWFELLQGCRPDAGLGAKTAKDAIRPGQMRFIRRELGRWKDGFYFVPPGVLVLERLDDRQDAWRVAQIFPEVALAAPGDLALKGRRTGLGELMVECWNTYTMKGSHLGPVADRVSPKTLKAVLDVARDPKAGQGAGLPEMAAHDVRLYFRELEVEVAFVFSAAAVAELMAELEKPGLKLVYDSAKQMKAAVTRDCSGIRFPEEAMTEAGLLAAAEFPPERYRRAAATGRETVPVNIVIIRDGRVKEVRPVMAEIMLRQASGSRVSFGGRVEGVSGLQGLTWAHAVLRVAGKLPVETEIVWDKKDGQFLASFDGPDLGEGVLSLAVFCQQGAAADE